jgi:hypothetical protein
MLDFKELSQDGTDLELLVREILFARGYRVYWSGKGADGGRDLLCYETHESLFEPQTKVWLVQCKHKAHSNKSVTPDDLDQIVDSCIQHGATGYLLVCSTQPSAALVERLESITKNGKSNTLATYWDAVQIERLLTTPRSWPIAQRFFPKSANLSGWQIYATREPNRWIANYRGYYFHLTNRIGSTCNHHLASIEARITQIEAINLPEEHFLRPRAIFYDDKHGAYTWYIDYMRPRGSKKASSDTPPISELLQRLGDGYSWTDGQIYTFDIREREYIGWSDHYDIDHYDYYVPYVDTFVRGRLRPFQYPSSISGVDPNGRAALEESILRSRDDSFSSLIETIKGVPGIKIVRAINCMVEYLDDFRSGESWIGLASEFGFDVDRFFSAKIILNVSDSAHLFQLVEKFPNGALKHYRLTKVYWLGAEPKNNKVEANDFDLILSVNPAGVDNKYELRKDLNAYFDEIITIVSSYLRDLKKSN